MTTRSLATNVYLWQGEPLLMVARIETAGGTPIVIANVTSFGISVFDMAANQDQATPVYQLGAIPAATGFFDTLQFDDAANLLGDSGGYNFKYILDYDDFRMQGGSEYRVQIDSTVSGSSHIQVYRVRVGEVL